MNKKNLEFNLTWCETNLRWRNGVKDPTAKEVAQKEFMAREIARIKRELEKS